MTWWSVSHLFRAVTVRLNSLLPKDSSSHSTSRTVRQLISLWGILGLRLVLLLWFELICPWSLIWCSRWDSVNSKSSLRLNSRWLSCMCLKDRHAIVSSLLTSWGSRLAVIQTIHSVCKKTRKWAISTLKSLSVARQEGFCSLMWVRRTERGCVFRQRENRASCNKSRLVTTLRSAQLYFK